MQSNQRNIAIFASGNGSNAENIINYLNDCQCGLSVSLVVASRPDAFVIQRAGRLGVPVEVMNRQAINDPDLMMPLLQRHHVDFIVLAGFLLMVPLFLLHAYPERILNIHPSLLPRHGGKGMYGRHVHQAVVDSGDTQTGITVHFVSEEYDRGRIVFQTAVPVEPSDTHADVERKIHLLEKEHFPRVIKDTFIGM